MHRNFDGSSRLPEFPARRARSRGHVYWLPLAVLITGVLSSAPVAAQEAQGAQKAEEAAVTPSAMATGSGRSARVCRYEDVTGSRMGKRVCRTSEQWEARERSAKAAVRELDNKPVAGYLNEE